jgi:hypothetical protein
MAGPLLRLARVAMVRGVWGSRCRQRKEQDLESYV